MSYQVIARKWRPKSFEDVVGQNHISQTLQNALRHQRLHHALLFTGPRGTGKTSTARILAKSLRCSNAKDFVPCNTCQECEDIGAGRGINVLEIDGASNNGVDAVRELRDSVGYMPSTGQFKIYIIDEVHMLSTSAFNALLKTLEEPPGHVIFVMATTEAHKIPNTILSRCQRFDFRRISTRASAERLAQICEADGVKADPQALFAIARQGDGSLRDSQSLLDQVMTFAGKSFDFAKVVEVLGLTDRSLLLEVLRALVARDTGAVVQAVGKMSLSAGDPKVFIEELLEQIRNSLMLKLSSDVVLDLPDSEIDELRKLSASLSEEDLHLLFDMALKGASDLTRATDPRLVLEMVLLRMACAPRIENLVSGRQVASSQSMKASGKQDEGLRRVPADKAPSFESRGRPQGPVAGTKSDGNAVSGQTTQSSLGFDPKGNLAEQWHLLVGRINSINSMVGAPLEAVALTEVKDRLLKFVVSDKKKFIIDKLKDDGFSKKLLNYIGTYWGSGYTYEVVTGDESSTLSPKAFADRKENDRLSELRRQVEAHPLVKTTAAVFNKSQIRSIKEIK